MYRLDGRLIALGVLDLLPHGVSSVYLIYHEDVTGWEFGKLSALREIAMAIEEGYGHYYMGYYIHSCTKMRYKRSFYPTYVLDPESLSWDLFDDGVARRMSVRPYVSMSRERRLGLAEPTKEEVDALRQVSRGKNQTGLDDESDDDHVALGRLFDAGVPGTMTMEQVQREVELRDVRVRVEGDTFNLSVSHSIRQRKEAPLMRLASHVGPGARHSQPPAGHSRVHCMRGAGTGQEDCSGCDVM
jgi:Arginine-tRNA-protein transferase, C terminus